MTDHQLILSVPEFGEPPADAPAAPPTMAELVLAGFYARYPSLVRYRLHELGLPLPRLTDPRDILLAWCAEGLARLAAEEAGDEGPVLEEEGDGEPAVLGERDPWRGYLLVSREERDDFLARYRLPFRVLAVRLWRERSGGARWHLLIERAPLCVKGVVKVPCGNAPRDRQLAWLRDELAAGRQRDLVLCFFLEAAGKYHRLALTRCEWLAGPEARPGLPANVRRYLVDRPEHEVPGPVRRRKKEEPRGDR